MTMTRVDKGWQAKGLDMYSTPEILGTLAHYGVKEDEASFLKKCEEAYPLGIAHAWHEHWAGKGQFLRFPVAASEELWRRLKPGVVAPSDVTLAIVNLLEMLDEKLAGEVDDGSHETRFKVVEAYLKTLPEAGDRQSRFLDEVVVTLGDWLEVFDTMARALAKKEFAAEAQRFVALEEALFPLRRGTSSALLAASSGDRQGGVAALNAIAADATRGDYNRLSAIDCLLELEETAAAKQHVLVLLAKAEETKDVELASEAVAMLSEVLERDPDPADRKELQARVESLAKTLVP